MKIAIYIFAVIGAWFTISVFVAVLLGLIVKGLNEDKYRDLVETHIVADEHGPNDESGSVPAERE